MQQQDGNVRGRREGAWNSSDCVLIRPYLGICTTLADVSDDVPVLLLRQSNHTEMTVSSKLISSSSLSNVEVWNHSIHRGRQPPNSLTPTLEYTTVVFSLVRISKTRSLCSDRVTAYVTKRIFLHLPEKSMPSCSTEVETLLINFAHASPRLKRPALCATLWISSRVKLVTKSILLLTPEAKTKIVISLQAGSLWEWVRVGPSQTRSQGAPFGVGRALSYTTV